MKVLIDIVHPAHVHFFRHLRSELLGDGNEVLVVARDKDVTIELLDEFEIEHISTGQAVLGSMFARAGELVRRVRLLRREIQRFQADLVLTRNPSGVQAAWTVGVPGVFDTDDGSAVGVHFWAARPFATVITSPQCLEEDYGDRHYRYPGFKALAYLHPNRFEPDLGIRAELGLRPGEPLFVLRFSAHTASHDRDIRGLSGSAKDQLLRLLSPHGRVLVSDEAGGFARSLPVGADRLHHVLAAADLCIGDSQTVAAEAAMLGTPAIRLSSFSGHVDYLRVLEERYGLIQNFRPGQETAFLTAVEHVIAHLPEVGESAAAARALMLAESVDVTAWYRDLVYRIAGASEGGRGSSFVVC